jgi:putative MATE family efflux protein
VSADALLTARPAWTLLKVGLPLALGMASHAAVNLVDLVMVGRFGPDAVAGVHVATTVNFLPMILGNGVSIAALAAMSRRLGAGDTDAARGISSRCNVLMLVLGVVVGLIGAALVVPSVEMQGVVGEARGIGIHYLLVSQLGCVTMFALMMTTATMRANGETAMPVALLLGANVLNLGLNFLLMFGGLGIPAFGAPGAAYASVIARGVAAVVGFWWIARASHPLRFVWPGLRAPAGERRELFHRGLPQTGQMLVRALAIIALTRIAGDVCGPEAIVALGVTTRLDSMILFATMGFASAATTLVGRQVGAGRGDEAPRTCFHAGIQAALFGAVCVGLFASMPGFWFDLFVEGGHPAEREQAVLYLRVAAFAHLPAAFCIAAAGGLNGAGKMLPPMLIDLFGYLGVILPLAILAAAWAEPGDLTPVWASLVASHLVVAAGYVVYLRWGRWRREVLSG